MFSTVHFQYFVSKNHTYLLIGERGGSVVECRTPEREVRGSKPTAAVLCPWARHFTPRKYWLITQEAMAPSRHDWKIVDWDVKPQHNQPYLLSQFMGFGLACILERNLMVVLSGCKHSSKIIFTWPAILETSDSVLCKIVISCVVLFLCN